MRVRTWLLVVAGVAVLVAVRMPATAHWSGAIRVEVAVEVVDRASGRALPGATVEFVHPHDPDRAPVGGRTGRTGG